MDSPRCPYSRSPLMGPALGALQETLEVWNSPYAGVLHFRLQRTDLVSVVLDWLILRQ